MIKIAMETLSSSTQPRSFRIEGRFLQDDGFMRAAKHHNLDVIAWTGIADVTERQRHADAVAIGA